LAPAADHVGGRAASASLYICQLRGSEPHRYVERMSDKEREYAEVIRSQGKN